MKRPLLIALLTLGTVGGFAHGFASLRHHHHHRRAHFERHVAQVCVDAARRADAEDRAQPPPERRRAHHPHRPPP